MQGKEEKEEEEEEIRDGAHESFGVFDTRYRWACIATDRARNFGIRLSFFYDE